MVLWLGVTFCMTALVVMRLALEDQRGIPVLLTLLWVAFALFWTGFTFRGVV